MATRSSRPGAPSICVNPSQRLDAKRLWLRIQRLAKIGATAGGGVDRASLSSGEIAARKKVMGWAADIGARAAIDPIGNIFWRLEGAEPALPPVLTGGYLDTQPEGGKYAGAYGVLAAIEALAAIAATGRLPKRAVVACCWTNRQGVRFPPGFMGSEAFAGRQPVAPMLLATDSGGSRLADALAAMDRKLGAMAQLPMGFACHSYIETHIEQGVCLEEQRAVIGAVTGVQGLRRFEVTVTGTTAHVAATPRSKRRDSLNSAVKIITALDQFFAAPDVSFAVGQVLVTPNSPVTVPRKTVFSIDLRHRDNDVLRRLGDTVRLICESEKGPCDFTVNELISRPTVDFPCEIPELVCVVADRLKLPRTRVFSLAGHDAQSLTWMCPSGIIFIPCKGGISHNEAEEIEPEHATAGARVLTDTIWELANT